MIGSLFLVLYCEKKHGTGKKLEDFSTIILREPPPWAKEGIIYQIFPRVYTQEGTFKALAQKLEYIKTLDVDIIWLMPIFPIGKKGRKGTLGSPYSVQDFREVNPDYGTKDDFRSLINAIHQLGMKVIIGIVPNHSSNDNVLMAKYPDWFEQDSHGNFTREVADWSDVTDFNYDNLQMREYMLESLLYWIKEFDIDGYRCDVAGMIPYDFWEEAIPKLREYNNDIFLLAEWEDPKLLITGFHSDYGWTEYHLLNDLRKNNRPTIKSIDLVSKKDKLYPQNALPMRFLENHDEQRSLFQFGPEAIEAYATFIFTIPGIPLLYAGQEIGEIERPSLFEKSVLKWENTDTMLLDLYKGLIQLRKRYSCFIYGKFIPMQTASFSGSVGAFLREDDKTAALVICNLRNKTARKVIINMKKNLRQRLQQFIFKNYRDDNEHISFREIVINELLPYQTVVYVVDKTK
jgi:glycosidase